MTFRLLNLFLDKDQPLSTTKYLPAVIAFCSHLLCDESTAAFQKALLKTFRLHDMDSVYLTRSESCSIAIDLGLL